MEQDGFTLVKRKKTAKKKGKAKCLVNVCMLRESDVSDFHRRILKAKETLYNHDSTIHFLNKIKEFSDSFGFLSIVCYGLGPISVCRTAQIQAAFLLLLTDFLNLKVEIYDPIFDESELEYLYGLNFIVIDHNEEARRKAVQPTLFYMPHCLKDLYNNLLENNYRHGFLKNCFIIGNSFKSIVIDQITNSVKDSYAFIYNAAQICSEIKVPTNNYSFEAFSSMCLVYFTSDKS